MSLLMQLCVETTSIFKELRQDQVLMQLKASGVGFGGSPYEGVWWRDISGLPPYWPYRGQYTVREVNFRSDKCRTEECLSQVRFFHTVEGLNLASPFSERLPALSALTDDNFRSVPPNQCITSLKLNHNQLTSDSIIHIVKFKEVTHLDISHNPVVDLNFSLFCDMKKLKTLAISNTQITGTCFKELANSNTLERITMRDCRRLDPSKLVALKDCKTLRELVLERTAIENEDLDYLVQLQQLKELTLSSTVIVKNNLGQEETRGFSKAAFIKFRDRMPICKITVH
ncbi:leucine-rich repeat domain-containing protein [Calycomorphotria hydatis]|nr:leucine-rich repeat domain-containing protein [Calycomorphotria hydatis]